MVSKNTKPHNMPVITTTNTVRIQAMFRSRHLVASPFELLNLGF